MSVILEHEVEVKGEMRKRIFIYSKGADNVIFSKLKDSEREESANYKHLSEQI